MKSKRARNFDTFGKIVIAAGAISVIFLVSFPLIISYRNGPAKESSTRSLIKSLETAIAAYEFDWGAFPPDTDPTGGKSSQSLYYHLTNSFRKSPLSYEGDLWASQDCGPYIDIPVQNQGRSTGGHISIVDVWGRPLEYDNIRNDKNSPNGFTKRGDDDIRTDGKPRNLQGVDIFSRGKPGENRPIANFRLEWEK